MLDFMTRHPRSVGESYGEHLLAAWSFAAGLMLAALACFVHGLLPFLCQSSASRRVDRLHAQMSRRTATAPFSTLAGEARAPAPGPARAVADARA